MKVSRARSGLGSAAGPEESNIVRSSAQLNMALDISSTNILDQRMSLNPNPKFKNNNNDNKPTPYPANAPRLGLAGHSNGGGSTELYGYSPGVKIRDAGEIAAGDFFVIT